MKYGRIILSALACITLCATLFMLGCDFTAKDSQGNSLSAQEWEQREERVRRQAEDDTATALKAKDAEHAKIMADAKAAEEAAKTEALKRRKRFEAAVAKLQAQTGMELADLASVYDQNEMDASAALSATLASLNARAIEVDRSTAARIDQNAATITEASAQTEEALQRIEAKQARILGGIKLAEGAASTFGGPVGGVLATVLGTGGLGGLLFGAAQRKKAANIEAEKTRREATTKDIFIALEHLKGVAPEFKTILKNHKDILDDWMGTDGVNLVNELTK